MCSRINPNLERNRPSRSSLAELSPLVEFSTVSRVSRQASPDSSLIFPFVLNFVNDSFDEDLRTAPVCATRSARRHVLFTAFGDQPPACVYVCYYTYIHTTCRRNSQPLSTTKVRPVLCGVSQDSHLYS